MPIIKSAEKRMRQAQTRRTRNIAYKKAVRTQAKQVEADLNNNDHAKAAESLKLAISKIDRAVKRGVFHKNTGARRKSRLTQEFNKQAKESYGTGKAAKAAPKTAKKATPTKKTTTKTVSKKPAAKKTTKK